MKFATRTIHAAQPSEPETGSLIAPIFQTSTYEQESPGQDKGFNYSRTNNPSRQRLESVLADLEGVPHAAVFASGLAAENAVFQAYLRPGDEIVLPTDVYGGTYRILNKVFQPIGVVVRQIDFSDASALDAAITPRTKLVWIESPTNPRLLVYDIAAISCLAHSRGALVVVDNTFATPCFQQPFELGADIVVHSVTKYLAGHSDLIQGAALAKDPAVFEPIKFLQNATGAVPLRSTVGSHCADLKRSNSECSATKRTLPPLPKRSSTSRSSVASTSPAWLPTPATISRESK